MSTPKRRRGLLELIGDDTGPFRHDRSRSTPPPRLPSTPPPAPGPPSTPPPPPDAPAIPAPPSSVQSRVATSVFTGRIPFGSSAERMIVSLARTMGLTGLLIIVVGAVATVEAAQGRARAAFGVLAVLAAATGLWTLLSAWHFQRAVRGDRGHTRQIVDAFSNLRSIVILRALALFLLLALSCFSLSVAVSLLALL